MEELIKCLYMNVHTVSVKMSCFLEKHSFGEVLACISLCLLTRKVNVHHTST